MLALLDSVRASRTTCSLRQRSSSNQDDLATATMTRQAESANRSQPVLLRQSSSNQSHACQGEFAMKRFAALVSVAALMSAQTGFAQMGAPGERIPSMAAVPGPLAAKYK